MNQAWRLYSTPSSLWAQILKAKYFPQATLFTGPRIAKRSHIWIATSLRAELLRDGMRWFVGDGQTIRIWQDHWLPNGSLRDYIEGPLPYQEEDQRINSLWDNQTWSFDPINLPPPPPKNPGADLRYSGNPCCYTRRLLSLAPHNGVCSVKSITTFFF